MFRKAKSILTKHNKNDDPNSPCGLRGHDRRYVMFNGAVSLDQLQWLSDVLSKAQADEEMVLVAGTVS